MLITTDGGEHGKLVPRLYNRHHKGMEIDHSVTIYKKEQNSIPDMQNPEDASDTIHWTAYHV